MYINCLATGDCEYNYGDCDLFSEQACSEFVESPALILVEKEDCEEVSLKNLTCYGLPPFDQTTDKEVK